jgi:hypothetical protein
MRQVLADCRRVFQERWLRENRRLGPHSFMDRVQRLLGRD